MSAALRKESWLSGFWIVCGFSICIAAYRLSLGALNDPGPGMFPFIAGVTLCILSAIDWWNTTRAFRSVSRAIEQKDASSLVNGKDQTVTRKIDQNVVKGFHHGASYVEHMQLQNAVRDGRSAEVGLQEGLWSVAIGQAAHKSIDEGRVVFISEVMNSEAMS
jgi:hypothetical protein